MANNPSSKVSVWNWFDQNPPLVDDDHRKFYESICEWLDPPRVQRTHLSHLARRTPNSGVWFLKHQSFQRWLKEPNSLLWVPGDPGYGKSVLCSMLIENTYASSLKGFNAAVMYHCFSYGDKESLSAHGMLKVLLTQLARLDRSNAHRLHRTGESSDSWFDLSVANLLHLLKDIVSTLKATWIFVDGLDECPDDGPRDAVLDAIHQIHAWGLQSVHIYITSRPLPYQQLQLPLLAHQLFSLDSAATELDIASYITSELENRPQLQYLDNDTKSSIASALTEKANGMFVWVALQLASLKNVQTRDQVDQILQSPSKTLDDSYDRILSQIDPGLAQLASRLLALLCIAAKPLSLAEVEAALAIDLSLPVTSKQDFQTPSVDILSICPALVQRTDIAELESQEDSWDPIIPLSSTSNDVELISNQETHKSGTEIDYETAWRIAWTAGNNPSKGAEIRLSHYSVQEYLLSKRIRNGPNTKFKITEYKANQELVKACLIYLNHMSTSDSSVNPTEERYAFGSYAAAYWFDHYRLGRRGSHVYVIEIDSLILKLFLENEKAYKTMLLLYNPDYSNMGWLSDGSASYISPVYYLAMLGFDDLLYVLLAHTAKQDEIIHQGEATILKRLRRDNHSEKADLSKLDYLKDSQTVRSLVNTVGGTFGNPLQAASALGYNSVVDTLLHSGAYVDTIGGIHHTSLIAASEQDHATIVETLLNAGAHTETRGRSGSALEIAVRKGRSKVVELLTKDVPSWHNYVHQAFPTIALHQAAWNGQVDIVHSLLSAKADVNWSSELGETALFRAAAQGHENVVRILLRRGADPNKTTRYGWTAFQVALWKGHTNISPLLNPDRSHTT